MALADYKRDMEGCSRCSSCKWVPFNQIKSWRFAKNCPSICRYNFHAYSGSGRMIIGNSILEGRSELNDSVAEIIFRCQMCGACDTACKVYRDDIDLTEVLLELRAYCIEQGELIVEHMAMIDALKREDNVLGEPKARRGEWAQGLGLKDINSETCEVLFHAGCRYSYDPDLRDTLRGQVRLMLQAGVDLGIAGAEESCCGGRAYELGYRGEAENYADDLLSRVKASGARTLVTPCADGYAHLKFLYPRMGKELGCEVLHVTQYLQRLAQQGKLRLRESVPLLVTYHDPCHLGRMGEPFLADWREDKLQRPMSLKRSGRKGIFDEPRDLLTSIPGVELTEMERIREYSWCCGAGGGVLEAWPDFALWTANERLEEAKATGAEALVTACPWCVRVFRDAAAESGLELPVYDLADLVMLSAGITETARA
ncbi:MAG: (Fe-S)-binding protein [Actinomycetota bacterium]|nr:(Fe-S)-binding protein [Actinomycetota bacterium]MDD5668098.1 (Fe-S)-binding protein [Actinomycetota bacterium]